MERKKASVSKKEDKKEDLFDVTPPTLMWKKMGGGSLRFGGRIIKPGQTFSAREEEIPAAFRKSLICLSEAEVVAAAEAKAKVMSTPEDLYELMEKTKGWYNVINKETKKPVNERSLRKDEAEKLIDTLKA